MLPTAIRPLGGRPLYFDVVVTKASDLSRSGAAELKPACGNRESVIIQVGIQKVIHLWDDPAQALFQARGSPVLNIASQI